MYLKIGEVLFRLRDYTPIPIVIALMVFASADQQSLLIGTILMLFGEIIRIIGVSHIGGVSRTKTYSTGQKLITSGPFSRVRNPLYIGNFFLTFGIVFAANVHLYFTLGFVAVFFLQYIPIINWEENNLKNVFGEEFEEYKSRVPRWIPALTRKMDSDLVVESDFVTAIKSEKNTLLAAIVLYLVVLWRSGWFLHLKDTLF